MKGDVYHAGEAREVPSTLRASATLLNGSAMLREAFGDAVIDHYHHAAQWEIAEHDRIVTDHEIRLGFERA